MAVVSVRELFDGREGETRNDATRRYTRRFLVKTNDTRDGPAVVAASLSVPQLFGRYLAGNDSDAGALVESVRPRSAGFCLWHVDVGYSSRSKDPDRVDPDPLNRAPVFRWGWAKYRKALERDANGRAIVNSARDPFDPPPEVDDDRRTLSVERYELFYNQELADAYHNAVNSDPFANEPPLAWRCLGITGELRPEGDQQVYLVRYEFERKRGGWRTYILDRGFRKRVAGKLVEIVGKRGGDLTAAVLLNGGGLPLEDAQTTLAANITADALIVPVASVANFTAETTFHILVDGEVMEVVVRDLANNAFTVVRGQQGTAAAPHLAGATVTQEPFYHEVQECPELPFGVFNF